MSARPESGKTSIRSLIRFQLAFSDSDCPASIHGNPKIYKSRQLGREQMGFRHRGRPRLGDQKFRLLGVNRPIGEGTKTLKYALLLARQQIENLPDKSAVAI